MAKVSLTSLSTSLGIVNTVSERGVIKTSKEIVLFLFLNDFKSSILVLNPMNEIFTFDEVCDLGILIAKSPSPLLMVLILDSNTFILAKISGSLFSEFIIFPLNSI